MSNRASFLPRLSVHRPVTVLMLFLSMAVLGAIAYRKIPIKLMPTGFTPPVMGAWIPYQNSTPMETEEQIAKPVEEILRTVRGIREINTDSGTNGCWAWLEFAQNTNMDLAYAQVRDRLDRVKLELPDEIDRIWTRKFGEDDDPIVWVGIAMSRHFDDPYFLLDTQVKKKLERIDGVGKVEIWGADQKSIQILVDQSRINAYNINLYQVVQELRRDNFTLASGYVMDGQKKFYVRSLGKYKDLEEIQNLELNGSGIRLKDVAEVKYDVPETQRIQRINRAKGVMLGIFKESSANTVQTCDEVTRVLDESMAGPALAGMSHDVLFNQGQFIVESIRNLTNAGMWGGLFAVFVLYFFLRRMRMTFIITLAIPVSLLTTIIVLYFMGWSLNLMTLMGMMICVGLVIDNSVVVVENIFRLKHRGAGPEEASVQGASEVGTAITMATLTTVVVFLPLILMNDSVGMSFYMLRIGLPVILALVASLLVALVFIPVATTRFTSHKPFKESRFIRKCIDGYDRSLNWTLQHRVDATIIMLAVLMTTAIPMKMVPTSDEGNGNINDIRLMFDLPSNNTIEDSDEFMRKYEAFIYENEKRFDVRAVTCRFGRDWGQIRVFLHPPRHTAWWQVVAFKWGKKLGWLNDGRLSREEVIKDIDENGPKAPGVEIRQTWRRDMSREAGVSLMLYGDDTQTLRGLAEEVERRVRAIPNIVSVDTDLEEGVDEINLQVDREQVRSRGISSNVVAGTISYALRGIDLPDYRTDDQEIDVRIQLRKEDRETLQQLMTTNVTSFSGEQVPLRSIVSMAVRRGFGNIRRQNGKTMLSVKAVSSDENVGVLYQQIDQAMAGFVMPRGYSWDKGERYMRIQESNEAQAGARWLAITFVFLLMGVLFESFVLPLSVIVSIPFAFFGVYWLLFITGTKFDIMAGIGLIILIGVVVNNAIVLVDLVNQLRREGMPRDVAIIEAGRQRFRPILMTAATTVFGLLPMAVGNAALIGIPYAPMGRTLIGGLVSGTFMTLLVVPLFYTYLDDLRVFMTKLAAIALSKEGAAGEEGVAAG